ncbi:hypothetical protein RQP46_001479 [Phenoliferia psychrophenolica]
MVFPEPLGATRRAEINWHVGSGPRCDGIHLPYISASFSPFWVLYYAARQVAVQKLSPSDYLISTIETATIPHIDFPTLPSISPGYKLDKLWQKLANASCEAVVPRRIPHSAVAASTPFSTILDALPPFLRTTLEAIMKGNSPPTDVSKGRKAKPAMHYTFEHFLQVVLDNLERGAAKDLWQDWMDERENLKSSPTADVGQCLRSFIPAVLRTLHATATAVATPQPLALKQLDQCEWDLFLFNARTRGDGRGVRATGEFAH